MPDHKQTVVLHICCATCAAYVLSELRTIYNVTAFYYNPNIYPDGEYNIRMNEAAAWCARVDIPFIEEQPDRQQWLAMTRGHEQDPERGERCTICYRMRLERTASFAQRHGYEMFGTDLTISPHKDAERINRLGHALAEQYGIDFLPANFKKQDGFKKAMRISRQNNFYRQDYCGCIYSFRARNS